MTDVQKTYDHIYGHSNEYVYGEPGSLIIRIVNEHDRGSVLDLGCGDGRNALFLASKGFDVKALDLSLVGIEKMNRFAQEKGLLVTGQVADLSKWSFDQDYGRL